MKKLLVILASAALLASTAATAGISGFGCNLTPYIGIDAQLRHMGFKRAYGGNLTGNDYPQGNVYVGMKLQDFIGLEAGFEAVAKNNRQVTLKGSEAFFGDVVDPEPAYANASNVFKTDIKIYGPYLNLVGFFPMSNEYCLDLIASVGIAHLKIKIKNSEIIVRDTQNDDFAADSRVFAKRKLIPRASLGLQFMISECLGSRLSVGWENTSLFNHIKQINVPTVIEARAKDSILLSVGLFYLF